MRRFHLIALTPDLSNTLAIHTAAGWLLPWLDDNAKRGLPEQIHEILDPMVSTLDIVHEAPVQDTQSTNRIVQGYCAVVTSGPILSDHARLVANSDLLATPSVLSLQREAWLLACQRLHTPVADFDSNARVAAAQAWAEHQVLSHTGARVLSVARHRCSRHEYVVRLQTTDTTMYFKGGRERVADEGVLTHLLHGLRPGAVPETLAIDEAAGRWIYRELPGALLLGSTLSMSNALAVVAVLADLQKRAAASSPVRRHLSARCLGALDLYRATDSIVRSVFERGVNDDRAPGGEDLHETWQSSRDALMERCLAVDRLKLPMSVVFSDFWSRNILITPAGVGFIDLERSYWTLPFLSLWRFIQEVESALQTGGAARARIEAAFVAAWANMVAPSDMTAALGELPLLGRLFGLLLTSYELDLRQRDLGAPLPASYRIEGLSGQMRRVLECVVHHA